MDNTKQETYSSVQVCDATDDAMIDAAGKQKIFFCFGRIAYFERSY